MVILGSRLERQGGTSTSENDRSDVCSGGEGIRVRNGAEGSNKSGVSSSAEVVTPREGVTGIGRVKGIADTGEDVVLDEQLSTVTGVDTVVGVEVVVVEDVAGTETERGHTRVEVVPVVVVVAKRDVRMRG